MLIFTSTLNTRDERYPVLPEGQCQILLRESGGAVFIGY